MKKIAARFNEPAALVLACFAFAAVAAVTRAAVSISLPTEWSLSPPPDVMVTTGTLPESVTPTADGKHLVVVEGGQGGAAVRVLDPETLATQRVVDLKGAYGVPLPDTANPAAFWMSTAAQDSLLEIDASSGATLRTIDLPKNFWAAAIARSPDGKTLAVSGDQADAVVFVDLASGVAGAPVAVGHHPAGVAYSSDGKTLFVANWSDATIDAIDVATSAKTTIAVGKHPEALLFSPDGATLYASEPDDDAVAAIDVASRARVADANVGIYGGKVFGASPTALAFSPDARRLYVACSAANAIAVLDLGRTGRELAPAGAIPTGWYPTALAFSADGKSLFVADGKGEGQHPNPLFNPLAPAALRARDYIASNTLGSIRRVPMRDDAQLRAGLAQVRANGGPLLDRALTSPAVLARGVQGTDAGRSVVRAHGPIRHVIYIVKENRTYDQVLGDEPGGDGDPALALFDKRITPNQHAIAERFGLFDDTYADAQVSADGHNWSMAAFANDYLEKMWPPNYGGRRKTYDFEDHADASIPHGLYLWNDAVRSHVSLRNYGEFTSDPDRTTGEVATSMPDLATRTDPKYRGFDLSYSDLDRFAEWRREFAADVENGTLPQLVILRFPNDHTSGTRPDSLTPQAYVAQNDLAVGKTVDLVSHSRYWKDTLIVSVEDDAQNGPDHVDAQRMPVYIASPYARGGTQHAHYSTAGIVRTIELILGMPPMSAYDAAALPLYAAFKTTPDLRPFDALPEHQDLDAKNTATSYKASESARLDFSHADAVDDATLNDIVWHAVKGASAPMPSSR